MRRCLYLAVGLLSVLWCAQALAQPLVLPGSGGSRGGNFTTFLTGDPSTFNPLAAQSTSAFTQFLGSLTVRNPENLEVECFLCSSFEIAPDQLSITYHLRQGVVWSDGTPFSADDVILSARLHADPEVGSAEADRFGLQGRPVRWEKIDDHTVRQVLPLPDALATFNAGFTIVPAHVFGPVFESGGAEAVQQLYTVATPPQELVGINSFLIEQYRPGEALILRRNPNWFGVDQDGQPLPYLDTITMLIVQDNNAALAAFLAGDLDFYVASGADQVASIGNAIDSGLDAVLNVDSSLSFDANVLVFNWNHSDPFLAQLFRNVNFRRAMSHLVDRDTILEVALGGLGEVQFSPVSPANFLFFDDSVPEYPYDPDRAVQLLADLGFRQTNPQGVLIDASGHPLEFLLLADQGNPLRETIVQIVGEEMRSVGVGVEFRLIEFNALVERLTQVRPDGTRDFDAAVIGITGGFDPPLPDSVYLPSGGLHIWNLGSSAHPASYEAFELLVDRLLVDARLETNIARRLPLYQQAQRIIADNVPLIFTVVTSQSPAVSTRIAESPFLELVSVLE